MKEPKNDKSTKLNEDIVKFFQKRSELEQSRLNYMNSKVPKETINFEPKGSEREDIEIMSRRYKEYLEIFEKEYRPLWPTPSDSVVQHIVPVTEHISEVIPCAESNELSVYSVGNVSVSHSNPTGQYCKEIRLQAQSRPNMSNNDPRFASIVAGYTTVFNLGGRNGTRYSLTVKSRPRFEFTWVEAGSYADGYATLSIQSHFVVNFNGATYGPDLQQVVYGNSGSNNVWGHFMTNRLDDIDKEHNITLEFEKTEDSQITITEIASVTGNVFEPVGQPGGFYSLVHVYWPGITLEQLRVR